jgi:biopolymer transport protein ExbB
MEDLREAWQALRLGGLMVYPLLAVGVLAMVIILDRAVMYFRCLRLPSALREAAEALDFNWHTVEEQIKALAPHNAFRRFLGTIVDNRNRPVWWIESHADDEAGRIDKALSRGLWVLETVVTGAPLLGLLGTITGMMQAFKVIGEAGVVAPSRVTAGVAEALIATALGLFIAIIALFAFNFYERVRAHALDTMERLGSKLVAHIRLDQEHQAGDRRHEAA